ncbi:DUF3068 domain-containing protein [Gordonia sp. FQ]|uniref:DUF3068 domain-containing protein n=1 Tax=Gordonia sp. FQ TaxID=3446634 RepID=UPI003F86B622
MPDQQPRLSTRDLLGPTAIFFGALLIAVAVAVGPLLGDTLRKVPLDIDQTWVADGSDGTQLLDRCSLDAPRARVVAGAVQQHRRILAVRPANARVVTLQAGTALGVEHYLIDGREVTPKQACAEATIDATVDRVTLDRATAAPTGSSEIQYSDQRPAVPVPDRRGYTYVLPFGFRTGGAQYFDPSTRRTLPMRAVGTETVDGRQATHFVIDVPDTDLAVAQQDPPFGSAQEPRAVIRKPAAWFGTFPGVSPTEELVATLHHRATRDLYVDRATGVILSERAQIHETYRFAADVTARSPELAGYGLTNIETTLASDPQTVRDAAREATRRGRPLTVVTRAVPIAGGVAGVVLLGTGWWLLRRRSHEAGAGGFEPEPGPISDPDGTERSTDR